MKKMYFPSSILGNTTNEQNIFIVIYTYAKPSRFKNFYGILFHTAALKMSHSKYLPVDTA